MSRRDFEAFGLPYLKRAFDADVSVKFFHNDAPCKACAPGLPDAGINLLNFGVQHTLSEMKAWTGDKIALVGNVPPRDVLAAGTPADVTRAAPRGACRCRRKRGSASPAGRCRWSCRSLR